MTTARDHDIAFANDVLAAAERYRRSLTEPLVQLAGSDPVRPYIPAVSPPVAARLLGQSLWHVQRHILDGHLSQTGKRKKMVPLAEVEALLGHQVSIRDYFTALGVPRA